MKKKHRHIGIDASKLANLWKIGSESDETNDSLLQIGNYKIESQLGEGGFGIVYLAEQQAPIKRRVALKIIKPGMDTKKVISRFEAERQALALLNHPHIAKVFDAGSTDEGRPYFVMEYVEGIPITHYCDQKRLSIKARLVLFVKVCEAIHHAHQKGIIHRDIKPTNILVSEEDGQAIPKVIDFGIAKAISQHLTEETIFTEQGQLVGTPEYMSPEQADPGNQDIDTLTDVYSLGILLYELLTGTLPFESQILRRAAFQEIQRIIAEQEPPRPSSKVSVKFKYAKSIAHNRQTSIKALHKELHDELEWIPLMAIRKERGRRYQSAAEFSRDVLNYFSNNPLIAGPDSVAYRFKKFVKKRRKLIGSLVSIVVILIAGGLTASFLYLHTVLSTMQFESNLHHKLIDISDPSVRQYIEEYSLRILDPRPRDYRGWDIFSSRFPSNSRVINYGGSFPINAVCVSPDGKYISSAGIDGRITIWSVNQTWSSSLPPPQEKQLIAHEGAVLAICFSPDSRWIASGGKDGRVKIWDVISGSELISLGDGQGYILSISFAPNGKTLVTGNSEGIVTIWDVSSGRVIGTLTAHGGDQTHSVSFSGDGDGIVAGHYNGSIMSWHNLNSVINNSRYPLGDRIQSHRMVQHPQTPYRGQPDYQIIWETSQDEFTSLFSNTRNAKFFARLNDDERKVLSQIFAKFEAQEPSITPGPIRNTAIYLIASEILNKSGKADEATYRVYRFRANTVIPSAQLETLNRLIDQYNN